MEFEKSRIVKRDLRVWLNRCECNGEIANVKSVDCFSQSQDSSRVDEWNIGKINHSCESILPRLNNFERTLR